MRTSGKSPWGAFESEGVVGAEMNPEGGKLMTLKDGGRIEQTVLAGGDVDGRADSE